MRSRMFVLFAIVAALSGGLQGCGDDDTCADCSCDPSLCDDGDGGDDADADSDGDAPPATATLHVETWTLSSDGTPRDLPGAQAEVDGQHCATPCNLELPVGDHELSLTLAGWVQGPNPLPINLIAEAVTVNEIPTTIVEVSGLTLRHRLDRRLEGRYRCESDGTEEDVVFYPATRLGYTCPDSFSGSGPFGPLGSLCIEGETLSLCKTRASGCTVYVTDGQILEDGRRIEFTLKEDGMPIPESDVLMEEVEVSV